MFLQNQAINPTDSSEFMGISESNEIENASEESLIQLMNLWQQLKKKPPTPQSFMRFAGSGKTESHLLQQLEQDIEINR